jgi:hypothetical protein
MYTISEFRDNLRQAFEDANQGHEVMIDRYGQKFQLVALVDKPLPGHSFSSSPKKPPAEIGLPAISSSAGDHQTSNPVQPKKISTPAGPPEQGGTPRSGLEALGPDKIEPLWRNKKKGKL